MSADQPLASDATRRPRWRSLFWFCLTAAAAGWIVWSNREDVSLLGGAGVAIVMAMIGLHLVSLLTQSERFRLVLEDHSGLSVSFASWLQLFTRGRLFSFVIPQSGNVYRGIGLSERYSFPITRYVSSLATQTWLSVVFSLVAATALAWTDVLLSSRPGAAGSATAVSAVALVAVVAPFPLARLYPALPARVRRTRVAVRGSEVINSASVTLRNPRVLTLFMLLVMVGFIASAVGLMIAFEIVGADVPLLTASIMVAFVHVSNLVAITPGNLGIQELGLAAVTGAAGFSPAAGVLASVVVRISNIAALLLIAASAEGASILGRNQIADFQPGDDDA